MGEVGESPENETEDQWAGTEDVEVGKATEATKGEVGDREGETGREEETKKEPLIEGREGNRGVLLEEGNCKDVKAPCDGEQDEKEEGR